MSQPDPLVPPAADVEVYATEADWLAARRHGLGASEAAAALGLSPFLSPLDVWADKVGLGEPKEELERLRWGRRLQASIAQGYAEETGRTVLDPGPFVLYRSRQRPWLAATPDAVVVAKTDHATAGILEVKNVSAWTRKEWEAEAPVIYQIQGQLQMVVSGYAWGAIAALLGGQELRHQDLDANADAQTYLVDQLEIFWTRYVVAGTPPPVDGRERTTDILRALYPRPRPNVLVSLPPAAVAWDERIRDATKALEALESTVNEAKNQLRAAIGDAEGGVLPDGSGVWWHKLVSRKEHTVPASEGRVLRRGKVK